METIYWIIISVLFVIGFAGLIYPIIPSVLFIAGGFVVYGLLFSFSDLGWLFWTVQLLFVILLFGADSIANLWSVKKFGGTKAGMWGSTIGLLAGPFIIPAFGIIIGPFLGAVLAEFIVHRTGMKQSLKIGFGSVIGFVTSVAAKFVIQAVMVAYFLIKVV
ncbi:DUF456 domain-containing protein [Bacillus sp. 1P06AnD]|uniref:DUF456 domain-containing protein n=1 Tax=Bacillus sp. 1P06AnD TaxID=3132208 RepID=UPI0039A380D5